MKQVETADVSAFVAVFGNERLYRISMLAPAVNLPTGKRRK